MFRVYYYIIVKYVYYYIIVKYVCIYYVGIWVFHKCTIDKGLTKNNMYISVSTFTTIMNKKSLGVQYTYYCTVY